MSWHLDFSLSALIRFIVTPLVAHLVQTFHINRLLYVVSSVTAAINLKAVLSWVVGI